MRWVSLQFERVSLVFGIVTTMTFPLPICGAHSLVIHGSRHGTSLFSTSLSRPLMLMVGLPSTQLMKGQYILPSTQLMKGQYINPWLRRFYLEGEDERDFRLMDTAADVQQVMPDQHDVVQSLQHSPEEPFHELCKRAGYLGKARNFTCLACLVGDARIKPLLPATDIAGYLDRMRSNLEATMVEYRQQHGIWPCPIVLLQETQQRQKRMLP